MGAMFCTRAWCCQLGPDDPGRPTAAKGVLDSLMSWLDFSQITPLAADETDHPCKIAHLLLCRVQLQAQVSEPKEEQHHFAMHCTNPSIPEDSSNSVGDVPIMAI